MARVAAGQFFVRQDTVPFLSDPEAQKLRFQSKEPLCCASRLRPPGSRKVNWAGHRCRLVRCDVGVALVLAVPGRSGWRFPAVITRSGRGWRGVGETQSQRLPKVDGIPACPVGWSIGCPSNIAVRIDKSHRTEDFRLERLGRNQVGVQTRDTQQSSPTRPQLRQWETVKSVSPGRHCRVDRVRWCLQEGLLTQYEAELLIEWLVTFQEID